MIFETLILLKASFAFVLIPNHRQSGCKEFHLWVLLGDLGNNLEVFITGPHDWFYLGDDKSFLSKTGDNTPSLKVAVQSRWLGQEGAVGTRGIRSMGERGRTWTGDYLRLFYMLVDSDWVISLCVPQFLHPQNRDCAFVSHISSLCV